MSNATLTRELWRQAARGLAQHVAITAKIDAIPPGTRPLRPGDWQWKRQQIARHLATILDRIEGEAGAQISAADRQRLAEYRDAIRGDTDAR